MDKYIYDENDGLWYELRYCSLLWMYYDNIGRYFNIISS